MKLPLFILVFVLFSTTSKLNYLSAHVENENLSLRTENPEEKIKTLKKAYQELMNSEETEKAIQKALVAFDFAKKFTSESAQKESVEILLDLGAMYANLKQYKEALSVYNQALSLQKKISGENSEEVLKIYFQIAYVNNEVDNFNDKMKALEKAEQIIDEVKIEDRNAVFNVYMLFVHSYIYYGDMDTAKKYLKKSNTVFEENKNDGKFMKWEEEKHLALKSLYANYLLTNLRIHIIEGNHTEVLKYFNLFEKEIDKNKTDYAENDLWSINNFYIQMALYYTRYLNDYEGAIPYFEEVLEINKNNDFQWGIIDVSYFFAFHYMHFKEWDKAIYYLKSCLENPEYENYTYSITIHQNLGSSYFYNCEFENAIKHFDIMMDAYETQSETYQGVYAMRDLYELGNIYLEIYEDNKDKKILEKAYKAFQMSSKLFSSVYQGNIYNDYLSVHHGFITKGLLYCSFILKDKQKEAMELIEMNNSDFLWTNFITKQDKNFLHSPIELKDQIYQLEQELNSLENEMNNAHDPEIKKELLNQKKEKEESLNKLNNQLQIEYKSFYNFTKSQIDTKALQAKMDSNEVMVKYIVTDNALYAFKITKTDVQIKKMRVSEEYLQQQVVQYISELKERSSDYQKLSKHLHQILISNLNLEFYEKIVFINDSFLSYLPFETLIDNAGEFLLKKYQISYSNSLKLLNIQQIDEEKPEVKFIAFSPDYSNENAPEKDSAITPDKNHELLGAKKEAKEISKLFKGDLYVDQNATKNNFLKKGKDYNFIHLAMHAVVDEEDSNLSNLIFQNGEKLYFKEFYEIDLPAQMVVLSACNTGVGNIKEGEGVVSLSRAFTFAGVKSTLMSLWQIPDKETPEIMFSFYENLNDGKTKTEALQQAKLNYLQTTNAQELKHPYYWAGFVISGDTSALSVGFPIIIYWIGGLVLLILLFFLIRNWIKNQSNLSNSSSASSTL